MKKLAWTVMVVVVAAGCGGRRAPVFRNNFPTPAKLDQLARQQPGKPPLQDKPAAVERWQLAGPLPTQLGMFGHRQTTMWDNVLASAIAGKADASEDMHCIAREMGRFALAQQGDAPEGLRDFVYQRCGTTAVHVNLHSIGGKGDLSETEIFNQWKAEVEKTIEGQLDGQPRLIGLWYGTQADQHIVVVASGRRRVSSEPIPLVVGAQVELRGEVTERIVAVQGAINDGTYAFQRCTTDAAVALPRFVVRCPVNPNDASTRVTVGGWEKGRYLGSPVLEAVLYPGGQLSDTWVAPSGGTGDEPGIGGGAPNDTALTAAINDMRGKAGLPPVTLSPAQSMAARRLAPLYFAAVSVDLDLDLADTIALGIAAGWDVSGVVREGHFTSAVVWGGGTPAMAADLLAAPFSRAAILDPTTQNIAIGMLSSPDGSGTGAVVATYATFSAQASRDALNKVLAGLAAARARRGLPPPSILPGMGPALKQVGGMIKRGEVKWYEATASLQEAAFEAGGRGASAYTVAGNSLDELDLPDDMVGRKQLAIAAVVTYQKLPNVPWAPYVLLIIYA